MTSSIPVRLANDEANVIGEGPVWDAGRNRLLWVDIARGLVFTGELTPDGRVTILDRERFDGTVGAVAVSATGDWLVATAETLVVRTADGARRSGPRILAPGQGRRLNDGKADPAGRFVVGSLSLSNDDSTDEILAVVDADGTVRVLDSDLTLSNGLTWTEDGAFLYSVDTLRRTISKRPYDVSTGTAGARETFLTVNEGLPDGMTIDAEGHLWVAMWGIGEVHRYSPLGELVAVVDVPAPHTSSVAFAGPLLDTLVITTATHGVDEAGLADFPDSGRLFTARPGVRGVPQPMWGGFSPTTTDDEL